ncbi:lymphocyte antigen 6D isoform X1 [Vespula squamosa]|uniref:Lymphocyte antigen 6D isoform X1 n=1 Tax=Vespula squamosa TaxID=30214 RepID=A0ABD2B6X8_VESSQ
MNRIESENSVLFCKYVSEGSTVRDCVETCVEKETFYFNYKLLENFITSSIYLLYRLKSRKFRTETITLCKDYSVWDLSYMQFSDSMKNSREKHKTKLPTFRDISTSLFDVRFDTSDVSWNYVKLRNAVHIIQVNKRAFLLCIITEAWSTRTYCCQQDGCNSGPSLTSSSNGYVVVLTLTMLALILERSLRG